MRILLTDDHLILLDGLKSILGENPQFNVVATCVNGSFALAHLIKDNIELLITDYSMPDMDGLTLVKKAKNLCPNLKIIILTMHDEPVMVQEMIALGVDAYILKKYAQQELLNAVYIVKQGGKFWSNEINYILIKGLGIKENQPVLTDRELEVLKLLIKEKNSREIAEKLYISERTVETHRKNMIRKTNSSTTVGLIKYAFENGLI